MKKAQMKIQEMAFVLVGLVLLFAFIFIIYIKLQSTGIEKETTELKQSHALSLLDRVIAMPELRCSAGFGAESLCIDKDKLDSMSKSEFKDKYKTLWKGVKEIKIKEIYPESGQEYVIFSDEKQDYTEYSAFTRICKDKYEGVGWQQCSIGIVMVSV